MTEVWFFADEEGDAAAVTTPVYVAAVDLSCKIRSSQNFLGLKH
jgi:hypothetical protein